MVSGGKPEFCDYEQEPGECKASIASYYYDGSTNTCKIFYYGGCYGNKNRFSSEHECEETCATHDS